MKAENYRLQFPPGSATLAAGLTADMRALVVEDEPDLQRGLAKSLREEGLYKAENWDYDAILLDVMLPRLDGWELLRCLRKTKKPPVLLLIARERLRPHHGGGHGAGHCLRGFAAHLRALLSRRQVAPRRQRPRGAGLSICKAVVDAHGGEITAASQSGAGATFTVRLSCGDGYSSRTQSR